jgi:lysophospholipase L1-like esterase
MKRIKKMTQAGSFEFHGDSTQAGATPAGNETYIQTKVPPALYVQMMADQFNKRDANIVKNLGVGGSTARDALTKKLYGNGTLNFAQHIAQSKAKYIVCNWGINDNYMPGSTTATFVADYVELKNIAAAAGKVFIAETSNPLDLKIIDLKAKKEHEEKIEQFANALLAAGLQHGFEVIDTFHAVRDWFPSYALHLADGIHPNSIMYQFIGEYAYKFLNDRGYFINKPV